jgi:hypothetical protein
MAQEFFREEEAEAILRLAAQRSGGEISRARLMATAAELGISPEEVEQAEVALAAQRQELESKQRFERHMKAGFFTHFITYTVVNIFLVLMNFMTGLHSLGEFWAGWAILGWGIAVAIHFGVAFFKKGSAYVTEYEKWRTLDGSGVHQSSNPRLVIGVALGSNKDSDT